MENGKVRIIFYDFETTGFNPYHDNIIEIGAIDNLGGKYSRLLKSKNPLRKKITEITGITNNLLLKKGVTQKYGLRQFVNFINQYGSNFSKNNKVYMVAHNNDSFDQLFLTYQLQKYNLQIDSNIQFIDTLRLSQLIRPNELYHNMNSLCNYFDIENKSCHRAMGDAEALSENIYPLLTLFRQNYKTKDLDFLVHKLKNPFST